MLPLILTNPLQVTIKPGKWWFAAPWKAPGEQLIPVEVNCGLPSGLFQKEWEGSKLPQSLTKGDHHLNYNSEQTLLIIELLASVVKTNKQTNKNGKIYLYRMQ